MLINPFLLVSAALISVHQVIAATDKTICFLASWAVYRPDEGALKIENIDPTLCSHVLYSFLGVEADGTLRILDPWSEINLGGLAKVKALKTRNPDLKVLISVGGYSAGHRLLEAIVASSELKANFIKSTIAFLEEWRYDGLDVNWQYPFNSDKENFVRLLQEIKNAFDEKGYILSVTVASTPLACYDVPQISKVADLINPMTYDYNTNLYYVTSLTSPLYGIKSVNNSIISWLASGADAAKLTLSVPFFGRTYSLYNENQHDVGAGAASGISGPFTKNPGTIGYNEICQFYWYLTRVWDDTAQAPYIYYGTNWFSYEDAKSVGLKAKFAKDHGLAGVAIWSIDTDDFYAFCGVYNALLRAIKDNISA